MTKDFFIDFWFENAVVELYTICYNITDVVLNIICHTYNLYFTRYILYKYSSGLKFRCLVYIYRFLVKLRKKQDCVCKMLLNAIPAIMAFVN